MNRIVWIVRAQTHSFGWSDHPAIYGDVFLHEKAAVSLANKLSEEYRAKGVSFHFAVYKCEMQQEIAERL